MSEQAEQTNTPTDITKLKKTELIDIICKYEENKFGVLTSELGLPYDDDEEWIEYIKKLQDLNAERLNDCNKFMEIINGFQSFINNTDR